MFNQTVPKLKEKIVMNNTKFHVDTAKKHYQIRFGVLAIKFVDTLWENRLDIQKSFNNFCL